MNQRLSFLILLSCLSVNIYAQRAIIPTDSFTIEGSIQKKKIYTLAILDSFPKIAIKDQIIYNHKGEIKDTLIGLKGVLLKSVLTSVEYIYDKPKQLNEFYFTLIASDGYKVVFSWNEIYNTYVGNQLFLITDIEGKSIKQHEVRIACISTADLQVGRRYIKGLQKILVKQVN